MKFELSATLRKVVVNPQPKDGIDGPVVQVVLETSATRSLGDLALFVGQSVGVVIAPDQLSLFEQAAG